MKNDVEDTQTPEPETTEPQVKEKTPPKKIKKSSSIIKKFKLKTKSSSSPSVSSTESESRGESKPSTSSEGVVVPEEEIIIASAVSDSNLTETNWESAENLVPEEEEDAKTITTTTISIASTHVEKKMPAFGELILDASSLGSNQNNRPNRDHLYKILVIGDLGAGKTSIIKRYVHDFFSQHYRATIGVDFALKVLHWDANTVIRLQLWDIAGQERYGNMTRVYYKEAVGAFIVFDVTRANTFESVNNWKSDLDSKVQLPDGSSIPCVLLGNKCDQHKEGVVNNAAKMDEFCKDKGFAGWFETSAKENINIEEAANALISKILENDVLTNNDSSKDKDQFTLTSKDQTQNGKKCYKC